jgi:hypothetical protein
VADDVFDPWLFLIKYHAKTHSRKGDTTSEELNSLRLGAFA